MINEVDGKKSTFIISKGTFRVRFSQENQFAKVDKQLVRKAEEMVINNSRLQLDRLSPSTEIWYSIRREGFGFCGQLISKREFTEKNLNKGELRPEVAYFMNVLANPCEKDVVCDCFAGYGSIPVQLVKNFRFSKLYVSDISKEQYEILKNQTFWWIELGGEDDAIHDTENLKMELLKILYGITNIYFNICFFT